MPAPRGMADGARRALAGGEVAERQLQESGVQGVRKVGAKLDADTLEMAAAQPDKPGFFGGVLNSVSGFFQPIFMLDIFTPVAAFLASIVLTPVALVGKLTGREGLRNFPDTIKQMIGLPLAVLRKSDVSAGFAGALDVASQEAGKGQIGNALGSAAQRVRPVEARVGSGVQRTANWLGGVVERIMPKSAGMAARADLRDIMGTGALASMQASATRLERALGQHPVLNNIAGGGEILEGIRGHLGTIQGLKAGASHEELAVARQAMQGVTEGIAGLGEAGSKLDGVGKAVKALSKVGKPLEKHGGEFLSHSNMANFLRAPREAIANLPQTLGKTSLHQAGFNAALGTGMAARTYYTVADVRSQLRALKEMCADLEGTKTTSLTHALFGSVPKPVATARSEMMKQFGPQLMLEGINNVMDVQFMRGKMNQLFFLPLMAMQVGGAMVQSIFTKPAVLAKDYCVMKKAHAEGVAIEPSAYAALLCASSNEISKLGLTNGLVDAVAKEYATEKASPASVLQEVSNGKLEARATRLQIELEAQGRKAGDETPEAIAAKAKAEAEKGEGAVAPAVKAEAPAAPEPQHEQAAAHPAVVGKHTAKLMEQKQPAPMPVMEQMAGQTPGAVIQNAQHLAAMPLVQTPMMGAV